MTDKPLMGVKELADYLRGNISTVYLWSWQGQIPAMKEGNWYERIWE